ncbi:MAG: methyltransferase domain-containing protein [Bacteroidetes bacterium]|nr:methyltransferase domain-containing protein [Bacteroidota bacterium]
MNQEWYRNWFNAPYYHLLYEQRDEKEAAAFIDRLINQLQPPPNARMLDIACGKGRHSIHLAAKGYWVTGIDISPQSILSAKEMSHDRLEFFVHDMRLPFRINYYDYAFNFFTSFGYFDTLREHQNALRSMAAAVRKGGYFILDYLNPVVAIKNLTESEIIRRNNIVFSITREADERYIYKKITVSDPAIANPLQFMEKVANFSLNDFTQMFGANHLNLLSVSGNYQLDPFIIEESPRMIMIAQKS